MLSNKDSYKKRVSPNKFGSSLSQLRRSPRKKSTDDSNENAKNGSKLAAKRR